MPPIETYSFAMHFSIPVVRDEEEQGKGNA
jgi:hypothetical protein